MPFLFMYEMDLLLKRKVPNNISQGNGTSANQSSCKDPPSSHTKQNSFYQENQSDDIKSLQNGESKACTEEILKLSGVDRTGVFNDLKNAIKIRHYSPDSTLSQLYLFSVGRKLPLTPVCNCSDVLHICSFRALKHTGAIREDLNGQRWSAASK